MQIFGGGRTVSSADVLVIGKFSAKREIGGPDRLVRVRVGRFARAGVLEAKGGGKLQGRKVRAEWLSRNKASEGKPAEATSS